MKLFRTSPTKKRLDSSSVVLFFKGIIFVTGQTEIPSQMGGLCGGPKPAAQAAPALNVTNQAPEAIPTEPNGDHIKIITIGNSMVGKSLFLKTFLHTADPEGKPSNTAGVDFFAAEITIKGQKHKLGLWDTAGQEQFRAITASYYRQAEGVFLVYDITDRQSWTDLKDMWLREVDDKNKDAFRVVIANKQDLKGLAVVENGPAEKWCKDQGFKWFATSAKTDENVQSSFEFMVTQILERKQK